MPKSVFFALQVMSMSMSSAGIANQPSKPSTSWLMMASLSLKVNFMFGMSMSRSAVMSALTFFR